MAAMNREDFKAPTKALALRDIKVGDALPRGIVASPMLSEGEVLGGVPIFTDHVHRFNNDEKRLCAALARLAVTSAPICS